MGKGKAARQAEEDLRRDFIEEMTVDLVAARALAARFFGKDASTEAVLGCYQRMSDADDDDDLEIAHEIASGGFETPSPTPEMVFGVYDLVIDDGFDEDEDDEEDD